jgi:hypothetical protein
MKIAGIKIWQFRSVLMACFMLYVKEIVTLIFTLFEEYQE